MGYKSNHTNLYECKEAFKSVIKHINPKKPFNVVAHSFGSAVTTYTLSKEKYLINNMIFLTSPNSILDIFIYFKNLIKLSDRSFNLLLDKAKNVLVIGCFCIGTNQVDLEYCSKKGISVINSPFMNTRSVAELVISHIINLSRHLNISAEINIIDYSSTVLKITKQFC